jgi:hypothetical protein
VRVLYPKFVLVPFYLFPPTDETIAAPTLCRICSSNWKLAAAVAGFARASTTQRQFLAQQSVELRIYEQSTDGLGGGLGRNKADVTELLPGVVALSSWCITWTTDARLDIGYGRQIPQRHLVTPEGGCLILTEALVGVGPILPAIERFLAPVIAGNP